MTSTETLLAYASIFEKPRRFVNKDGSLGPLIPPTEPCMAAARALRFYAKHLEGSSPGVPVKPNQGQAGAMPATDITDADGR